MIIAALMAVALTQPDPTFTPGQWRTDIDAAQICAKKWGLDKRAVTDNMKLKVFQRYGFSGNDDARCAPAPGSTQRCEIDHRFTRELGGADALANLWPQAYAGPWNAHDKDRLENYVHDAVCIHHVLSLDEARAMFEGDWHAAYIKAFGGPPLSASETK